MSIGDAQARTNAKLRYARIHLCELQRYDNKYGGDDFEKAHEESLMFHLFGARDAFLQELNIHYQCGLDLGKVRLETLKKALQNQGHHAPELHTLEQVESDSTSWLNQLKEFRDCSTHRRPLNKVYDVYVSNSAQDSARYKDPRTNQPTTCDTLRFLADCCDKMERLLSRLRPY